jgi:hypothetical protein
MKIIDLNGSTYERGLEQGRLMKDDYNATLDTFFTSELWAENKPINLPLGMFKWVIGAAGGAAIRRHIRRHMPEQLERIRGIGEGLGDRRFVWGVQFLEIIFCAAGKSLKVPSTGCTQIHAQPAATRDKTPLVGRNYDFPNLLQAYQCVRREIPTGKDRLATTTITHPAHAGTHMGINEAGLVVAANNARIFPGKDFHNSGVPYMLILMEILETCKTTEQAAAFMENFPARANAGFFGMMDKSGDCRLVEFTASRTAVRRPNEKGVLAQTNHYHVMKDANLPDGTTWNIKGMEGLEFATSTNKRFEWAERMLNESAGDITIDTLKTILGNHKANNGVGDDCTVCAHGISGGTLAGIVADIAKLSLWVADGPPCSNAFNEVPFRNR